VLSPRLPGATLTITGKVVPGILALVYVALVASHWSGSEGGFSSLPAVAALFSDPWILLAGWTHYLAFDLLVGNWEMSDARKRGIPYILVLPCLVLTFLFGPAGWLLYEAVRSGRTAILPEHRLEVLPVLVLQLGVDLRGSAR
jgi:ABC-type uncharacterized transport system YnjBCD permease subunit